MCGLKKYNATNFFKHTFCEFQQIDDFDFPENTNYKSKSDSTYFYTNEGVFRKSNHWGRVANCRWKLMANKTYKNQDVVIGFAKWTDFYPINSNEKSFFIDVNYDEKTAKIQPNIRDTTNYLFTFSEAQNRIKQINHLFKDNKWATYFDENIEVLRFKIIATFISSDQSLLEIKRSFK